jgi:hypothetical protein
LRWLVPADTGNAIIEGLTDDRIRTAMHQLEIAFREGAPTTATQAATIILDGIWRILVGDDAQALDRAVRASPETAYERSFVEALQREGFLTVL